MLNPFGGFGLPSTWFFGKEKQFNGKPVGSLKSQLVYLIAGFDCQALGRHVDDIFGIRRMVAFVVFEIAIPVELRVGAVPFLSGLIQINCGKERRQLSNHNKSHAPNRWADLRLRCNQPLRKITLFS